MKKGWEKKRLNDFAWFQRGFDLPKKKFITGGVPVYGSTSILGYHNIAKVEAPGIITGRSGTLGVMQFAKEDFWPHNTSLWVKDFKGNDEKFAYYLFHCLDFSLFNSGGAVPTLNRNVLNSFVVDVPPLATQRKIASILSAYDDLIENNIKRIKLLEEKAQLTYEEWFVRMRFPGRENWKVDEETGLPEGWEEKPFSSIVDVNPKTTIKKGTIAPYIPMRSISESSMVIMPIEERAVSGGTKFKNGDTLFARITPCLENGKTGFVQFMKSDEDIATGSTEYIVLRETPEVGKYFIYCTSREEEFRENAIKSMVGSDGRQRVKSECFEKYIVNHAPLKIRNEFEKLAEPIFLSIQLFVDQNQLLKEARDLLLPRLMMGMINVDKIPVQIMNKVSESA